MVYKNADLHIHSRFSDGSLTIEEIFRLSKERGLRCISITDHDTVQHIPPSLRLAERFGIELIPGVEITASHKGKDVHLLGYFIDPFDPELIRFLGAIRRRRIERITRMLENLAGLGLPVNPEDFFRIAGEGTIGRPQLADYLCTVGIAKTVQEAFDRWIGTGCPAYVEIAGWSPEETIRVIHSANGLAVLAHPGITGVDPFIPEWVESGLDGIEVHHSAHTPEQVRQYRRVAKVHGLFSTGGSDCHGRNSDNLLLGQFGIDYSEVGSLKSLRSQPERRPLEAGRK
jgi:predicted metal-dependent phosphoesterase TrpH